MHNQASALKCIMERGFDIDTPDRKGKSPAHYAAEGGSLDCLKVMVDSVMDICVGDDIGLQPIHYAAMGNRVECLKFLLQHGASETDVDRQGRTVLHVVR